MKNSTRTMVRGVLAVLASQIVLSAQAYTESFDEYSLGSFPSSGGWELIWNGAGNGDQIIVNSPQRSGYALQLVGSSCWDAAAFYPLTISNNFTLEADLLVTGTLSGGCNPYDVQFGVYNPSEGTWGTAVGVVTYQTDGKIHASYDTSTNSILMAFQENTWNHVALDFNFASGLMGIRINNGPTLMQSPITAPSAPTGIWLDAGHGSNPTLFIDNIALNSFEAPNWTSQPADQVIGAGQSFSFAAAATGYPGPSYQWEFSTNGTNWTTILGATGSTYSVASSGLTNIGYYRVQASNSQGTNASAAASLTFVDIQMYAGIRVYGPIGAEYSLQSAGMLNGSNNWNVLSNVVLPSQPYIYIDYNSPSNRQQFYRAVPQ